MAIQKITSGILADGAIVAADIANGSITTAKIADGNVTSAKIDTVANTKITGLITSAQIANVANTQITGTSGTGQVALNTSPVITTPTLTTPVVTNYTETQFASNTGTAITISLANGTLQNLTCNASTTITLPASSAGKSFIIIVGYTGSYTVAWSGGSTIKWPGGTTPTATSTSGKYDIFSFFQDGVNTYGQSFGLNY